ncbi:MAG: sigma 54-interacting transcriptional regulator [Deltaproteobacteria bacterium]|nr:sigma 54-interacting transcriptional regulator [Deltaproteobacteria bacterium]
MFEAKEYLRTILETMQNGLMVVDEQGELVTVNPALEELTGYSRGDLIGSPCSILGCKGCRDERAAGGSKYCALFSLGGIRRRKCEMRRKDGKSVSVLKNAALLRDSDGQVLGGVETLTDVSELAAKEQEIFELRRELCGDAGFEGMLGRSPLMERLYQLVQSAARSEASVLITGETGTGKELVAQAIHRLGRRSKGPFVQVNCAAFNESLLESELFGHVRGAFTGAERNRVGRFEAAHRGDILLDELGDMPLTIQVKLLRSLQEKKLERVGDNRAVSLDVRILSATNRDLKELMRRGEFREDLYFRVAALPIRVPALRHRRDDIPLLLETFLRRACAGVGRTIPQVDAEALRALFHYPWPGNVRELMNAAEYGLVMAGEGPIRLGHLPPEILGSAELPRGSATFTLGSVEEREWLRRTLENVDGKKAAAAAALGISRVTLWRRLKAHGLD